MTAVQVTISLGDWTAPGLRKTWQMQTLNVGAVPAELTMTENVRRQIVATDTPVYVQIEVRPTLVQDGACNWCGRKAGPTRVVVQGAGMAICEDCVTMASTMIGSIETRRPV